MTLNPTLPYHAISVSLCHCLFS